jgi:MFS family permease
VAEGRPGAGSSGGDAVQGASRSRNVAIGCFATVAGMFSGGMVAVLIGRLVEGVRRSPSCEGLPICNWYVYWWVGAVLGAVSLPILVLRRLRRRDTTTQS